MQIRTLKVQNFRSFSDSFEIRFADDLTIFYGSNGTGKSSLAESIEWLFFGYTTRRRKGELYSKTEYKGSYINIHGKSNQVPSVKAEVLLENGKVHTIRRCMVVSNKGTIDDTISHLYVDDTQVNDLSCIGVSYIETHRPIVVQHGVQDLIHIRPVDRYRAISEILGLSELVLFGETLEKSRRQYNSNLPSEVRDAQDTIDRLVPYLVSLRLDSMATRWKNKTIDLKNDYKEIESQAQKLTGSTYSNPVDLINALREKKTQEQARIFDMRPYYPHRDISTLLKQVRLSLGEFNEKFNQFIQTAQKLKLATVRFREAQIRFWQLGLNLIQEYNLENCPFCEKTPMSKDIIEKKKEKITNEKEFSDARKQYQEICATCEEFLKGVINDLQSTKIKRLEDIDHQKIQQIVPNNIDDVDKFIKDNHLTWDCFSELANLLENFEKFFREARLDKELSGITNSPEYLYKQNKKMKEAFDRFEVAIIEYEQTCEYFGKILNREISNNETVAQFEYLIDLLNSRGEVNIFLLSKKFNEELDACKAQVEEFLKKKQVQILAQQEKEIKKWYNLLSPNTSVGFSGLKPGKREFKLNARIFGNDLNAAAYLSQAQLNCLGLSIYIPGVLNSGSPFRFILFDDPVQAMDDEHHESFILNVVPALLDGSLGNAPLQVIILTHLQQTADRLRHNNYERKCIYYRFDKIQPNGPKVNEYFPLKDELKRIKDLSKQNDEFRKLAVDRIRVLCEYIIRETYVNVYQTEVPSEYNSATAKPLLDLFKRIDGVSPKMAQGLECTIKWSNPSHHTQQGWQVPPQASIEPHIQRLETLIKQLGLNQS
jgi:DNA repair ATPase RecN